MCSDGEDCEKCSVGYYMSGEECVAECPSGEYGVDGQCEGCNG